MAHAAGGSAVAEHELRTIGHQVPHPGQLIAGGLRLRLGAGDGLLELLAQRKHLLAIEQV
jgi:hypothetical protein